MICKECGAYNPDHAAFCKVCAANLKEQQDMPEKAEELAPEQEAPKPEKGSVQAPDFSARKNSAFAPMAKEAAEEAQEEAEAEETEPEQEAPNAESRRRRRGRGRGCEARPQVFPLWPRQGRLKR